MAKKKLNSGLSILFGITFLSPVTYSIIVFEMEAVQRIFFFSVSLLLFLIYLYKYKSDEKIPLNKFLLILIVFFPLTFFTAFVNDSGSLLILRLSEIIVPLTILLQSAVMLVILGEEKFFRVVSYSVVIVSTIFSIIGLLEVFQIKIIPLPSLIPPGSTLGHRSFAAEFLLPSLPFLLILNEYISKEKKIFLLIAACVNVSFLLFTRNRSGIIILIFVTLIYIVFIIVKSKERNSLKNILTVLSILAISFLISLIPVKGTERPDLETMANTFFDSGYKSNLLRINFWNASLKMIKEQPIAGIGLNKWSGYSSKYFGDYYNDENVTNVHNIHAHNDFLELFAENGILATLFFLLIYLSIIYALLNKIKHNKKYFPLLLTCLVTLAYSLVAFPNHKFSSFFLLVVAAGTALVNSERKNFINVEIGYLKWALGIIIILGGLTSYTKLKSEISFGESIILKNNRQYSNMLQKLEDVSDILYPLDASKQPVDYYRGIANYYLGNYKGFLKNSLNAEEIARFNPLVLNNIAAAYRALGNLNSAGTILERMKLLFPNYLKPQTNLLMLYYETGEKNKTKLLFDELIAKYPHNTNLLEFEKLLQQEE